jgi:hypothetical protein
MTNLQAKVVFERLRKARRDRLSRDQHGSGSHADYHDRRAAFWEAAAQAAADGDLTPVAYPDDSLNHHTQVR